MSTKEELLTVAAVARRIGVAPATLRTWDRRYGLGPSAHESGEHRRYCPADLARLTLMRRLITSGVSPCDAAAQAKSHKGTVNLETIVTDYVVREELVAALHKAAKGLDKKFIEAALRKDLAQYGVEQSWSEVIVPLLLIVGNEWEASGDGIEVEHLLTEVLKGILREHVEDIRKPVNAHPVLLASVGEELHSLALHALAAALAERKIETYFLGARTPLEALSAMITRSAPPAVFLWAQLSKNADPKFFNDIPAIRPMPRMVLGGPGWSHIDCKDVSVVHDISDAVAEIERAVGL
ncbi:transcriptional regulator [Candidatus Planktophila vernalis]|uniref:Transcriptional regulator n=1 Tax=Candidatus Planktophila vernalis TaxID=1884907 RepID=A0A249KRW6_9ACTN|nr:MerR family transcriptional regulator [Candidatus Planktophila vernalis]ASY19540.1 transcriptional regulator [Candidatus Planktophila vernalis]